MASNHQGGRLERARKVLSTLNSFFFGGKELDQILSCTMCEKQFRPHYKTPLRLVFCSFECYFNFIRSHKTNNQLCLMPGCYKDRFHDSWYDTWYDHCGRKHAGIHREQIREIYSGYRQITSTSMCDYYLSVNTTISFYEKDRPFYEFTNFANYPIIVDDFCYHSTEHYFQSQKLAGTPYEHYVALLPRPRDAFEFPRRPEVSIWVRRDWDKVKEDVMFKGLYHKFTQYPELKKLLLCTGDRRLVEDSPHDSYWGNGRDKNGRNRLGELLMRLRRVLRGEPIHITNHSRVSTDGNKASHTQSNDVHSSRTDSGDKGSSLSATSGGESNNLDDDRNNGSRNEGSGTDHHKPNTPGDDGNSGHNEPGERDGNSGHNEPGERDGNSGHNEPGERDGNSGHNEPGERDGNSGHNEPGERDDNSGHNEDGIGNGGHNEDGIGNGGHNGDVNDNGNGSHNGDGNGNDNGGCNKGGDGGHNKHNNGSHIEGGDGSCNEGSGDSYFEGGDDHREGDVDCNKGDGNGRNKSGGDDRNKDGDDSNKPAEGKPDVSETGSSDGNRPDNQESLNTVDIDEDNPSNSLTDNTCQSDCVPTTTVPRPEPVVSTSGQSSELSPIFDPPPQPPYNDLPNSLPDLSDVPPAAKAPSPSFTTTSDEEDENSNKTNSNTFYLNNENDSKANSNSSDSNKQLILPTDQAPDQTLTETNPHILSTYGTLVGGDSHSTETTDSTAVKEEPMDESPVSSPSGESMMDVEEGHDAESEDMDI